MSSESLSQSWRLAVGLRAKTVRKSTMSKDVLSTVVRLLAEKIGAERYDLWFGARTRFTLNGGNLLVETPNRFLQDWQCQHYREAVEAACREALGSETTSGDAVSVEFCVN